MESRNNEHERGTKLKRELTNRRYSQNKGYKLPEFTKSRMYLFAIPNENKTVYLKNEIHCKYVTEAFNYFNIYFSIWYYHKNICLKKPEIEYCYYFIFI